VIEVTEQISAVQRQVGTRVVAAGAARTMTIKQSYDTTLEDLWDACTNPERITRWFLPISGDLRVGGRFEIKGYASGTVERCDPPREFAATWEYGGQVSWIEVKLSAQPDGRAMLELEHVAHVDDQIWAEFGPGAVGIGWDMGLLGLARHLSNGHAAEPKRTADWLASPDRGLFLSLSSQRWRDANVAAGTN
jgi:uncharacterized protein YndB with AHSA1/START domain